MSEEIRDLLDAFERKDVDGVRRAVHLIDDADLKDYQEPSTGYNLLMMAAHRGFSDIAWMFIRDGRIDLEAKACEGNHHEVVGYDSDDVIHHIHTVQLRGQLRTFLFRRLLEAGNVDPKESDNSNVTPLMYAAGCGGGDVCLALLQHMNDTKDHVNATDSNRSSALQYALQQQQAAAAGGVTTCQLLMYFGADLSLLSDEEKRYFAQLLRENGADQLAECVQTANGPECRDLWIRGTPFAGLLRSPSAAIAAETSQRTWLSYCSVL